MSKTKRKRYTVAFKAKVGLEALMGVKAVEQIAREYQVHPVQVTPWEGVIREHLPERSKRLRDEDTARNQLEPQTSIVTERSGIWGTQNPAPKLAILQFVKSKRPYTTQLRESHVACANRLEALSTDCAAMCARRQEANRAACFRLPIAQFRQTRFWKIRTPAHSRCKCHK